MKSAPKSSPTPVPSSDKESSAIEALYRRHLQFGWWTLLIFLTLGIVLEAFHGFKIGAYLKVSNETRRLLWTLAHAHGTLLALVNIALAFTIRALPKWPEGSRKLASNSLLAATILMPAGFFLGGAFIYGGDPGFGILLLPIGAIFLFLSVVLTARATRSGADNLKT